MNLLKQIYTAVMQTDNTKRRGVLIALGVAAAVLLFAAWYLPALDDNRRIDARLKELQKTNAAAKQTAAEIMDKAQLREEARALEIRENIDGVDGDDLPVILRGLLLEYEAEQRKAGKR